MSKILNYEEMLKLCQSLKEGETAVVRLTEEFGEMNTNDEYHFGYDKEIEQISTYDEDTYNRNNKYDYNYRWLSNWRKKYKGQFEVLYIFDGNNKRDIDFSFIKKIDGSKNDFHIFEEVLTYPVLKSKNTEVLLINGENNILKNSDGKIGFINSQENKLTFDFENGSGCITLSEIINDITEIKEFKNFEYGQIKGSLHWAFEVARRENCKMLHNDVELTLIDGDFCYLDSEGESTSYIEDKTVEEILTGWYRKPKDAKEELKEEFISNLYKDPYKYNNVDPHHTEFIDDLEEKLKETLDKYKIDFKEEEE